ncbi:hypothetical protein EDD85DRAFT_144417 [Armillaria nabsnona]|nr:hypothetical protein EDD85DRAFT_144417 [Armillaria nabsnona]
MVRQQRENRKAYRPRKNQGRPSDVPGGVPKATVKQTFPVCLCPSSKMSATKRGHTFCSSCICRTFEKSQGCPSCQKPGHLDQLRKIDLHIL